MLPKVYIAVGVFILLIIILVYLRWNSPKGEPEEMEDESLPDDSDVDLVDEDEEFTIIDNE